MAKRKRRLRIERSEILIRRPMPPPTRIIVSGKDKGKRVRGRAALEGEDGSV